MNIFKKIGLIILIIFLFITLSFAISTLIYQKLVNEESIIADKQCMKVNPLIIERKNSYIRAMKILLDKGNEEDYMSELNKYMDISNKYIKEQTKWLEEQKIYMNKWSFKFFLPGEVKMATQLQYTSREADTTSTKAIVDIYNTTDPIRQKEYVKIVINQTKIANEADKKSDLLWNTKPKFDLRVRFVKVPPTKCPKENFNIPDVVDFFSPSKQINFGPIT